VARARGKAAATTVSDVPPAAGSRGPSGATDARRCSTAVWNVSGSTGRRTGTRRRARRRRPVSQRRWPRLQAALPLSLVGAPPRERPCASSAWTRGTHRRSSRGVHAVETQAWPTLVVGQRRQGTRHAQAIQMDGTFASLAARASPGLWDSDWSKCIGGL
jgi:hypothetical protein